MGDRGPDFSVQQQVGPTTLDQTASAVMPKRPVTLPYQFPKGGRTWW